MAKKNICSIPLDWTLEEYARHNCFDGSHRHISRAELTAITLRNDSVITIVREGKTRRESSIVQITMLPQRDVRWAGKASVKGCVAGDPLRDLSLRLGPYLAKHVRKRTPWALVMLSQVRQRPIDEEFAYGAATG